MQNTAFPFNARPDETRHKLPSAMSPVIPCVVLGTWNEGETHITIGGTCPFCCSYNIVRFKKPNTSKRVYLDTCRHFDMFGGDEIPEWHFISEEDLDRAAED